MSVTRRDGTEPVLSHGAVYLRPAERDDIPRFVTWLSNARTTRTLAILAPFSLVQEEGWFDRMTAGQGKELWHFVICRIEDDRPIGVIALDDLDLVNGSSPVGIFIGEPSERGRGYGTDAMRAILEFAFGSLRLERVWLDVYDFNTSAIHVYERVGFVREGLLRRAVWREGEWADVVRMAILADEWRANRDQ
jgi:diamine N-acetyltransferase